MFVTLYLVGMSDNNTTVIAALIGHRIIERFAVSHNVGPAAVRVLGLVHCLAAHKKKITARQCAGYLDCHYLTALGGANECVLAGWLTRQESIGWGLRLTLEGLRIAGLLSRAEREARVKIQRAELPKWPRAYVRRKALEKL